MKRLAWIIVLACLVAAVYALAAWEQAVTIITIPWVTVVLLAVGMTLLIAELMTIYTWGATGTAGAAFLALVFGAYIAGGTASWLGVILFLVGLGFLLLEAHVLPGTGISALAGIVCVSLGFYWALGGAANALFNVLVAGFFTIMTIAAFFVYLPRSNVWRTLGEKLEHAAHLGHGAEGCSEYLGQEGVAATPLKPAGVGEFGGRRLDVLSEGGFIPSGTAITVTTVRGARLIVRETSSPP